MTAPIVPADALALGQITLDGTQLGYYDDGTTWRSVADLSGWSDSPPPRTNYTDRPDDDGVYSTPNYAGPRTIGITGRVAGADLYAFARAKRQISGLCGDPKQFYELRVDDVLGSAHIMVQRSAQTLFTAQGATAADFSMSLTAPAPRILGEHRTDTTPMAQTSGLGIPWRGAGSSGIQWRGSPANPGGTLWRTGGLLVSGILECDNTEGTAPADIVFTIRGPALYPTLSTATSRITYGGALGYGDTLVIDTGAGSVLLNGGNRRPYLTSADWITVPRHSILDVVFSAQVQNSLASATAEWNVSYW